VVFAMQVQAKKYASLAMAGENKELGGQPMKVGILLVGVVASQQPPCPRYSHVSEAEYGTSSRWKEVETYSGNL
jgi:hypothetical protein